MPATTAIRRASRGSITWGTIWCRGPIPYRQGKGYREGSVYNRGYFAGNYYNHNLPGDPWSLVIFDNYWTAEQIAADKQSQPFETDPISTQEAKDAYRDVLRHGGAILPPRDFELETSAFSEVLDDPLDDDVEAIRDAVRSFPKLSSDFEDLVHADVRLLVFDKDCGRRAPVPGATRLIHGLFPPQCDPMKKMLKSEATSRRGVPAPVMPAEPTIKPSKRDACN
jgi:hypothetical protein